MYDAVYVWLLVAGFCESPTDALKKRRQHLFDMIQVLFGKQSGGVLLPTKIVSCKLRLSGIWYSVICPIGTLQWHGQPEEHQYHARKASAIDFCSGFLIIPLTSVSALATSEG